MLERDADRDANAERLGGRIETQASLLDVVRNISIREEGQR